MKSFHWLSIFKHWQGDFNRLQALFGKMSGCPTSSQKGAVHCAECEILCSLLLESGQLPPPSTNADKICVQHYSLKHQACATSSSFSFPGLKALWILVIDLCRYCCFGVLAADTCSLGTTPIMFSAVCCLVLRPFNDQSTAPALLLYPPSWRLKQLPKRSLLKSS